MSCVKVQGKEYGMDRAMELALSLSPFPSLPLPLHLPFFPPSSLISLWILLLRQR